MVLLAALQVLFGKVLAIRVYDAGWEPALSKQVMLLECVYAPRAMS